MVKDTTRPFCYDYAKFKVFIDIVCVDRNFCKCCADRLDELQQTMLAAVYAVEFKSFVETLNYPNNVKCDQFIAGLNDEVKKALAI